MAGDLFIIPGHASGREFLSGCINISVTASHIALVIIQTESTKKTGVVFFASSPEASH
jgi:hypothetical protein